MVREQGVRVRDIADLPWVAPALAALHAGGPLPLPFDDPASASKNLGADRRKEATAANAPVTPRRPTRPSPRSTAPPQPPTSRVRSVSRKTIDKQDPRHPPQGWVSTSFPSRCELRRVFAPRSRRRVGFRPEGRCGCALVLGPGPFCVGGVERGTR